MASFLEALLATLPDDDDLKRRFAWLQAGQNPVQGAGNVLGIAGTLLDVGREEVGKPAGGALAVGLDRALGRPLPQAMQATRADLARYYDAKRRNVEALDIPVASGLLSIMGEMAVDPTNLLGGPAAGLGRLGEAALMGRGPVGQALAHAPRAVARADEAYSRATGAVVAQAMRGAGAVLRRTPGVAGLLARDPAGALEDYMRTLQDALGHLKTEGYDVGKVWGNLDLIGALKARATPAELAAREGKGWQALERRIAAIDTPLLQYQALQAKEIGLQEKNLLEREVARLAAGIRTGDELAGAERRDALRGLWHGRHQKVLSIQRAVGAALDELEEIPRGGLPQLDDFNTVRVTAALGETLAAITRDQLEARAAARALRPQSPPKGAPAVAAPTVGDVAELPVAEIAVDPARFQFKANTDATTGAGTQFSSVERYDPEKGGIILVWRDPADGKTYVVNGHHRLELARRTGRERVLTRATDAATAEEARVRGALVNIAEGRGTAVDAAKIMRERGYGADDLAAEGISLREGIARDGLALARLDDGLFERVATGRMTPSRGAAIGAATAEPAQQRALVDLVDAAEAAGRKVTDDVIAMLARQVLGAASETVEQATLFGVEQMTRSLALEKATIGALVERRLRTERREYGFLADAARAQRVADVAQIDTGAAGDVAAQASRAADLFGAFASTVSTTSRVLDEYAAVLAGKRGKNPQLTKAETDALMGKVRAALEADFRGIPVAARVAAAPAPALQEALIDLPAARPAAASPAMFDLPPPATESATQPGEASLIAAAASPITEATSPITEAAAPRMSAGLSLEERLAREDAIYNAARLKANERMAALRGLMGQVYGDAPELESLRAAALAAFRAAYGDAAAVADGVPDYTSRISPALAGFLTREGPRIQAALGGIIADRQAVLRAASPYVAPERLEELKAAGRLTREGLLAELTAAGAPATAIGAITQRLDKYRGVGDLLTPEHTLDLLNAGVERRAGPLLGVKGTPPWLAPLRDHLSAWKAQALISGSFHLINLAGGLFVAANHGIPVSAVLRNAGENLRRFGRHVRAHGLRDDAPFDTVPIAPPLRAALGRTDEQGRDLLPAAVARSVTAHTTAGMETVGRRQTATGRLPGWERVGGLGLLNALQMAPAGPVGMVAGAVLGGATGAALPKVEWANRMLGQAVESSLRTTAFYKGFEDGFARFVAADDGLKGFAAEARAVISGTNRVRALADGEVLPATPTRPPDPARLEQAILGAQGRFSAEQVRRWAVDAGATVEDANRLGARWDQLITTIEDEAARFSGRINVDYSDISRLEAGLRSSGVAPFVVWPTRMAPIYATILIQHPQYLAAIDAYNSLSEEEIRRAGLTRKYVDMARSGSLGDWLAERVYGRPGALMVDPLKSLFPYRDIGQTPVQGPDATPLDQAVDLLSSAGVGLGPVATLPLMAAGLTEYAPNNALRLTSYLQALNQPFGHAGNIEAPLQGAIRGARRLAGVTDDPTITGDPRKDYAVRQRIAEIALAETGRPPAGAYVRAMDDPTSAIWRRALGDVERASVGQTALSSTLPVRTKFLSAGEADVRARQAAQGVDPQTLAALKAQPITERELAAARADTRRRPLREGEALEDRARSLRARGAWEAAERADPATAAFSGIGGSREALLGRQWETWRAFQARTRRLPAAAKKAALRQLLAEQPHMRAFVNELYA